MSERPTHDSSSSHPPDAPGDDEIHEGAAPRGRSEFVIAFGIVAIVSLVFGFVLGRLF